MTKSTKQFGVWMDSHHATITGRETDDGDFVIIGNVKNDGAGSNSNERTSNNHERTLQHQYFKEIASHMINMNEVHVTGTGDAQEQFIKYLAETPQFKNVNAKHSTSVKMGENQLTNFIEAQFNF